MGRSEWSTHTTGTCIIAKNQYEQDSFIGIAQCERTLKAHSHLASRCAFSKIMEVMVTKRKRKEWVLYPFPHQCQCSNRYSVKV